MGVEPDPMLTGGLMGVEPDPMLTGGLMGMEPDPMSREWSQTLSQLKG